MANHLKALTIIQALFGESHLSAAIHHANAGGCYSKLGMADQALTHFNTALRISQLALGPAHAQVGIILSCKSRFHLRQGEIAQALATCEQALDIYMHSGMADDHDRVGDVLVIQGCLYTQQGNYEVALLLLLQALIIHNGKFGEDHPVTSETLFHLGQCHVAMGDWTEARAVFALALQAQQRKLGTQHPSTVQTQQALDGMR